MYHFYQSKQDKRISLKRNRSCFILSEMRADKSWETSLIHIENESKDEWIWRNASVDCKRVAEEGQKRNKRVENRKSRFFSLSLSFYFPVALAPTSTSTHALLIRSRSSGPQNVKIKLYIKSGVPTLYTIYTYMYIHIYVWALEETSETITILGKIFVSSFGRRRCVKNL